MRRSVFIGGLMLAALGACGGGSSEAVGVSEATAPHVPVELALRTPNGDFLDLADLRGKPGLLFLFATFDGRSQASLRSLRRFVRANPDVWVLGVAVQPDPRQILDAWVAALDPPFPVAYDPAEKIQEGTTALGDVEGVPTFVFLDAAGYERARDSGFLSEVRLQQLLEHARSPH